MNSKKRIAIIQGHPDNTTPHLCHALADAYAAGAAEAGIELRRIDVAAIDFPLLRSQREWEQGKLPPSLQDAQDAIGWATHVVIFFPLWLGDMPALLKAFLEQVARPGFAFDYHGSKASFARKGLKGRSARVVVTMGMPAFVYRWFFLAHSVKSLERNILSFVGMGPIQRTFVGLAGNIEAARAQRLLASMRALGADGE